MPYIEVNQAQIFYRTYGKPHSDRMPILLIHGSTVDGQADWGALAPFLGMNFHVIVPDCRGHGRSSNPRFTYRFKEMASDCAVLLQNLGYECAHIIGHSNGGNVALCLLMEYPAQVKSCVLQAANAYVSQDLKDFLPLSFDPERVARESANWMQEMIELHSEIHGVNYWRDLLHLTLAETISEPNYPPDALSQVEKPVLVIQGELDRVNSPSQHAQHLAANIPNAQVWIPTQIGHNVHLEIPLVWLEKVLQFLEMHR